MNVEFKTSLYEALQAKSDALTTQIAALEAEGRSDEANLQKAGRNIYGIFQELLRTKDDEDALQKLMGDLESAWQGAREKADKHSDFARVAIEDAKLAALGDVRSIFAGVQGEAQA